MQSCLSSWVQVLDNNTGHVYYYNSITGASQWQPPSVEQLHYGSPNSAQFQQPPCHKADTLLFEAKQASPVEVTTTMKNMQTAFTPYNTNGAYQDPGLRKHAHSQQWQHQNAHLFYNSPYAPHNTETPAFGSQYSFPPPQVNYVPLKPQQQQEVVSVGDGAIQQNQANADVRCWGRPGRVDSEDLTTVGRFRSTSSVEPERIVSQVKQHSKPPLHKSIQRVQSDLALDQYNTTQRTRRAGVGSRSDTSKVTGHVSRDRALTASDDVNIGGPTVSMFQPDAEKQLKCVAVVVHTHMLEFAKSWTRDGSTLLQTKTRISLWDEPRSCSSECIPTPEIIYRFLYKLFTLGELLKECIVLSLIYLERLLKSKGGKLILKANNYKNIMVICLLMASKVCDDLSMQNGDFANIVNVLNTFHTPFTTTTPSPLARNSVSSLGPNRSVGLSLERLNELEILFLESVQYRVRVRSGEFAKYYFQLRAIGLGLGLGFGKCCVVDEGETGKRSRPRRQTFVDGSSPE